MAFVLDDAILLALSAASAGGAIFGNKKQKKIDPKWLEATYGPQAATAEAQEMFNRIINSPKGQQMIDTAAASGQNFGNSTQVNAAKAGLTPMGGGSSGTGVFATSAGDQASNAMMNETRSNVMSAVIPAAQQAVADRMRAYLNNQEQPDRSTESAAIWQQIGNAAGVGLSMVPKLKGSTKTGDAKDSGKTGNTSGGGTTQPTQPNPTAAVVPNNVVTQPVNSNNQSIYPSTAQYSPDPYWKKQQNLETYGPPRLDPYGRSRYSRFSPYRNLVGTARSNA